MGTLRQRAVDFLREQDGLTKVEYAVVAALIVVVLVTAYFTIGLAFVFTN
jgi:Flp pilus assembly pilin Flp